MKLADGIYLEPTNPRPRQGVKLTDILTLDLGVLRMSESNWVLEEFCKRVNELKSYGMTEDDAKKVVKTIMDGACDIMTGERTLTEVILSIPDPEERADDINDSFYKPTDDTGV
jgi:hypothetical protein